jgi:pilus assembly protein FimV
LAGSLIADNQKGYAMNRIPQKFWLSTLALAVSLLASISHAAGLGAINVKSALGQPLAAEVEVIGLQGDDLLTAQTRLGGPDDYAQAKLTYTSLVRQVKVVLDQRAGGKAFLMLSSVGPITEPAINLLVEFSWRGGRLVQKYPILLDPPK